MATLTFFINNGLDERPNDAYNWPGATLFWITTMYFNQYIVVFVTLAAR